MKALSESSRFILALLLSLVAVLLGVWGVGNVLYPFRSGYHDSPDSTYFIFGAFLLSLSALLTWGAIALAKRPRTSRRRTHGSS